MNSNMISILIPVYNYDCSGLVRALQAQCARLQQRGESFEIIVGDDASKPGRGVESVREACTLPGCRYVEATANCGRAVRRNSLAREAKGEWLLFIDCDALVASDSFVAKYCDAARAGGDVICGGIQAVGTMPSPDVALRFRYEQAAAGIRSLESRKARPYDHFSTFNVMVRRDVFTRIRFDESCVEYGYEDTIFGLRLKQQGYTITHIDNTLVHNGLDTNREFLAKTEQSMRNLRRFGRDVQNFSHVGGVALRLKQLNLDGLMAAWHTIFGPLERANLLGYNPSLFVFKIYKLGFLCKLQRKN